MNPVPKRLRNEPLIEVIWQAQFDDPNAGDLLPGVLFTQLKEQHRALEMRKLPAADIPAAILRSDPNLQYATKLRMEEPDGPFIWQVGDRVVSLNCRKPYVGWGDFRPTIEKFIAIIEASGLVTGLKRHSLRYLDLFTLDDPPSLSALKLTVALGDHELDHHNFRMRVELPDGDYTHNVQIATPAKTNLPEGQVTGTLVDMETVPNRPPKDWQEARSQLEGLHDKSKELFFRHVVAGETLKKLEPEY